MERRARLLRLALMLPLLLFATGCEQEEETTFVVPLSGSPTLQPPLRLALTPDSALVALVGQQGAAALALYRASLPGRDWHPWISLPESLRFHETDLAAAREFVAVAGCYGESLWVAWLPGGAPASSPSDATPQSADEPLRVTLWEADSTILALACVATPAEPGGRSALHLVYTMEASADSGRVLEYRRSEDQGQTWSPPRLLAHGELGRPCLYARPDQGSLDLGYSRDEFLRWRGGTRQGRSWNAEKEIRVRVADDSPNGIARIGHIVLCVGESYRQQVVCSTSRNSGHNWERATAIARDDRAARRPAVTSGFGLFWVAFADGDSLLLARATDSPWLPKHWRTGLVLGRGPCRGEPRVVALPDSSVGVLYATEAGEVLFSRAQLTVAPS